MVVDLTTARRFRRGAYWAYGSHNIRKTPPHSSFQVIPIAVSWQPYMAYAWKPLNSGKGSPDSRVRSFSILAVSSHLVATSSSETDFVLEQD